MSSTKFEAPTNLVPHKNGLLVDEASNSSEVKASFKVKTGLAQMLKVVSISLILLFDESGRCNYGRY